MTKQVTYKIGIVDDEALFRNGLSMLINQHANLETVLLAEQGKDLIHQLNQDPQNSPDLILCDLEMPVMNGVETVKVLEMKYPSIKVVVLSGHYESALILKMLEIGASAFIPKNENPQVFYDTILNVIKSGFHYNQHIVQLIREKMLFGVKEKRADLVQLSKREAEVLLKICEQKTNKQIAEELFISIRTVEGHRNNLINKVQVKNTAGLIIYAIEQGIFQVNFKNENNWLNS
jgi:DNA-binding NarL/FixJ family response regulator